MLRPKGKPEDFSKNPSLFEPEEFENNSSLLGHSVVLTDNAGEKPDGLDSNQTLGSDGFVGLGNAADGRNDAHMAKNPESSLMNRAMVLAANSAMAHRTEDTLQGKVSTTTIAPLQRAPLNLTLETSNANDLQNQRVTEWEGKQTFQSSQMPQLQLDDLENNEEASECQRTQLTDSEWKNQIAAKFGVCKDIITTMKRLPFHPLVVTRWQQRTKGLWELLQNPVENRLKKIEGEYEDSIEGTGGVKHQFKDWFLKYMQQNNPEIPIQGVWRGAKLLKDILQKFPDDKDEPAELSFKVLQMGEGDENMILHYAVLLYCQFEFRHLLYHVQNSKVIQENHDDTMEPAVKHCIIPMAHCIVALDLWSWVGWMW